MTTPAPTPRRKDAIATRERLMRAALELFTTEGYRATTTQDIAGRARIAEATIYRHFAGKEALFNEVYRDALRSGLTAFRPLEGERPPPARDRLTRGARRLLDLAQKDPPAALMLLRKPDGVSLDESTQQAARDFRDGITQIVASGKQEGTIRPGAADLWATVWLVLLTFVVERVAAREWTPDHAGATGTLDAAWTAIAYRASEPG